MRELELSCEDVADECKQYQHVTQCINVEVIGQSQFQEHSVTESWSRFIEEIDESLCRVSQSVSPYYSFLVLPLYLLSQVQTFQLLFGYFFACYTCAASVLNVVCFVLRVLLAKSVLYFGASTPLVG